MNQHFPNFISVILLQVILLSHAIADIEPNNLSTQANEVINDREVSGELTAEASDIDWYKLQADAGSLLSIDFSTPLNSLSSRRGDLNFTIIRDSDAYVLGQYSLGENSASMSVQLGIERSGNYLIAIQNEAYLNSNLQYILRTSANSTNQESLESDLSGLWKVGDAGYASIHQKGSALDVVVMGYSDAAGYRWETLSGLINDQKAKIVTTIGYVSMEIDAIFPTPTSAEFTVQSCSTIIAGNPCRFRPGITFFLEKILD